MQANIIELIARGDPDFRKVLDLVDVDPTEDWVGEEITEKPTPTDVDYQGLEVLAHSRIYDLCRWYPEKSTTERQGHIYAYDRIDAQLTPQR